jgi:hypothetical protein
MQNFGRQISDKLKKNNFKDEFVPSYLIHAIPFENRYSISDYGKTNGLTIKILPVKRNPGASCQ